MSASTYLFQRAHDDQDQEMTLLRTKLSRITVSAAGVLALAGLALGPAAGTGLAATQAAGAAGSAVHQQAPLAGAPFVECTNNPAPRTFPCEAETKKSPVFFYPHSGGASTNIGVGTEVFITCWYNGTPVDHKDMIQDHITSYNNGFSSVIADGHVPDYHVDIGDVDPSALHIPQCS
jgi:hypothetical protein